VSDPRDKTPDGQAIVYSVGTDALCVACIARQTEVPIDRVLMLMPVLEAEHKVLRARGRCRSCLRRNGTVFRLAENLPRHSPAAYDGTRRHGGVRCARCAKPIGVGRRVVVLWGGQPYHAVCLHVHGAQPQPFRAIVRGDAGVGASRTCGCSHERAQHLFERARKAWTVCRACRCVRFKPAPGTE
jgi:hypothetical protein